MNIFLKKTNNRIERKEGFVILFAVMLSTIILAVAFGVSNIALKELNFSTSAKASNDAFFAADSGVECVASNDRSTSTTFSKVGGTNIVNCFGGPSPLSGSYPEWQFVATRIGNGGESCAIVNIKKDDSDPLNTVTTIISKGYNIGGNSCASTSTSLVEREIIVTYNSNGTVFIPAP